MRSTEVAEWMAFTRAVKKSLGSGKAAERGSRSSAVASGGDGGVGARILGVLTCEEGLIPQATLGL